MDEDKELIKSIFINLFDVVSEAKYYDISSPELLDNFRLKFLAPDGVRKELFEDLKKLPESHRKEYGEILGHLIRLNEEKYNMGALVFKLFSSL